MPSADKALKWVTAVALAQTLTVVLVLVGEATGVTNLFGEAPIRIVCPGSTVVAGPAGPRGDTGPQGPVGESGVTGAAGPPGATGAKGDTGKTGATGATGVPGATGAPGSSGAPGAPGSTGRAGDKGEKGDTGATGEKGDTGATGATGAPGFCPSYHGSYYDTTTQTSTAGVATAMKMNSVVTENGISVVANTRVTVAQAGVYNIEFSAQLIQDSLNQADSVDIWLDINGSPVANSNTTVYLEKNQARYVAAWNFMVRLAAGDYAELMWYTATGDVRILAVGAVGARPAVPSVIVTIDQVASP